MTPHGQFEFVKRLSRLFDGTLADADAVQLAQVLAEDGDAYALYMRLTALDVALEWSFGSRSERDFSGTGAALMAVPGNISSSDQPKFVASDKTRSTPTPSWRRGSLFSRPALYYATLVALCFYGSFAIVAWNIRPGQLSSDVAGNSASVAVVRDAADVQWAKNTPSKLTESSILSGEPLKIDSGTIELELNTGTKLVVEGPADWSVDGRNSVSLRAGKLIARVPVNALGFTVQTPIAKIVDLGTEFGVETDDKGATEVQVFKGKVELRPSSKLENPKLFGAVTTLTAGEARRVEVDDATKNVVVHKINSSPNRSAQQAKVSKSRPLAAAAFASSEGARERGRETNNLVNGSGLARGKHTNVADGTMWHAAYGKVKGEFVLFDLFRPCRIESMKVWNYNEGVHPNGDLIKLYEERGVAQADIYVSATGKGDPISQPREWQLVVENRKFALANGTPHYSSPDVIPLGNVEARSAAIVVDSRHHPERTSIYDCVGLSEVQFFGERLPPKESLKRN